MVVGTRTNKSNNSGSSCTQKAMAASNVNAEKDSEICGTCKNIVKVNEKAIAKIGSIPNVRVLAMNFMMFLLKTI